jgi:hypothetical protein
MTKRMTASWHSDNNGDAKPSEYVGQEYFHPKTGHLYHVTGFGVDSERGLWLLAYVRVGEEDGFTYHHTIRDFQREGRFLKVKT